MANGKFLVGKPSGGVTTVTVADGATNTNLVLPESGTVSSVDSVVTDNAIARYDGTTGKLQNSGVTIDDNNHIGIGAAIASSNITTNVSDTRLANVSQYGINNRLSINPETLTAHRNYFGIHSAVEGTFANTTSYIPSVFGSYNIGTILSGSNSTANDGAVFGSFGQGTANNTADATNKHIQTVIGTRGSAYINIAGYNNVESMYGVYADVTSSGTRANESGVTNAYGVYITNPISTGAVTNNYGLYQATAGAQNYFAGPVTVSNGLILPNSAIAGVTTLDWYEEGTFTPTIGGTTTVGVGTYGGLQYGRYTRIGNVCIFNIYLSWIEHTGTGNIKILGLPFNSNNATGYYHTFPIELLNIAYTGTHVFTELSPNRNFISIYQTTTNTGGIAVPMDTSGEVIVSGSYICA